MSTKILTKIEKAIFNEKKKYAELAAKLAENNVDSDEEGVSSRKYCNEQIIVSLTSYEKRIKEVYLPIECIMKSHLKPNKIILWLGEEMKSIPLPEKLKNQQKRGLEIRYTEDIGSYKKLIPALRAFPGDAIITLDDDVLYPSDTIEELLNNYKRNPNLIYARRMHRIIKKNGGVLPYRKWEWEIDDEIVSTLNFPTGIGAVLYPPNCFDKQVFAEDVFMDVCKFNDDIWFKAMSLLNDVKSQKVDTKSTYSEFGMAGFLESEELNKDGLFNKNRKMNDIQIKAVFDKYELWDKLV